MTSDAGVHLVFPHSGGPVRGDFVGMHSESPVVTEDKVRLERCATGEFAAELGELIYAAPRHFAKCEIILLHGEMVESSFMSVVFSLIETLFQRY